MEFLGKSVLITGGSRGIGKAAAIAFAAQGAKVAVNFRKDKQAAAATIEAMEGDEHFAIKADVSKPKAVEQLFETVHREFGKIDIVVNNAGIYVDHPIESTNYQDWQAAWTQTLDVNLLGPANVTFCAAQYMIPQKSGAIINISSRGAFRGEPNHPAYGASKAGLNAMSQSLAQKLAPYGIFIGVIAPGFVATDMAQAILEGEKGPQIKAQSPFNRVALPEEVAHCILFLANEKSTFTTGCILDINGASYLRS